MSATLAAEDSQDELDAAALEVEFLRQYRRAALKGTLSASVAAALIFAAFLVVARVTEPYSSIAMAIRALLVALLLAIAVVVVRAPDYAEKRFVWLSGGGSLVVLAGTVYLLSMGAHGTPDLTGGGSPALVFGLFLHYAFLRLPLWCAAGIGWLISMAGAAWASPLVVGGNAEARTLLYLFFANVAGMAVCSSIESRERELFYQRRRAESAQKELRERALAAEEAHMEKKRLLDAVSHDLRQPMMAATTYLAVLRNRIQRGEVEQADRHAQQLADSIGLLGDTLDQLITAARHDNGVEPMRVEPAEVVPLLTQVRDHFSIVATQHRIELRVRLPEEDLSVATDVTALWRVLMNLVSNAIKFTEPGKRGGRGVLVSATRLADSCRIDIVDTGIGISPEHVEAIWQPYFQIENAQRDRSLGLGLGLFLVKRAIDQLPGHRITLRSRPGRGSRFSIYLPVAPEKSVGPAADLPQSVETDLGLLSGAFVLVLEDDRPARRALEALLEDCGVLYASGGTLDELLADLDASMRTVDAFVTDFRLPGGVTGADCVEALRRRLGEPVPAVIVTGESDFEPIRRALPTDAVLLRKPFEPPVLLEHIARAVRRARIAESL